MGPQWPKNNYHVDSWAESSHYFIMVDINDHNQINVMDLINVMTKFFPY